MTIGVIVAILAIIGGVLFYKHRYRAVPTNE